MVGTAHSSDSVSRFARVSRPGRRATALAVVVAALVPATALAETAWMASVQNHRAVALDTVSGRQGSAVGDLAVAGGIVVTPDGRTVYVAGWERVTPIDTATNTTGPAIATGEAHATSR